MMNLYSGTTCPFSHRCRIVLYEKGMDFQVIDVDLFIGVGATADIDDGLDTAGATGFKVDDASLTLAQLTDAAANVYMGV